jgi:hypothetical protein
VDFLKQFQAAWLVDNRLVQRREKRLDGRNELKFSVGARPQSGRERNVRATMAAQGPRGFLRKRSRIGRQENASPGSIVKQFFEFRQQDRVTRQGQVHRRATGYMNADFVKPNCGIRGDAFGRIKSQRATDGRTEFSLIEFQNRQAAWFDWYRITISGAAGAHGHDAPFRFSDLVTALAAGIGGTRPRLRALLGEDEKRLEQGEVPGHGSLPIDGQPDSRWHGSQAGPEVTV